MLTINDALSHICPSMSGGRREGQGEGCNHKSHFLFQLRTEAYEKKAKALKEGKLRRDKRKIFRRITFSAQSAVEVDIKSILGGEHKILVLEGTHIALIFLASKFSTSAINVHSNHILMSNSHEHPFYLTPRESISRDRCLGRGHKLRQMYDSGDLVMRSPMSHYLSFFPVPTIPLHL